MKKNITLCCILFLALVFKPVMHGLAQGSGINEAAAVPVMTLNGNMVTEELKITFALSRTSDATITILDLIGNQVKSFASSFLEPGTYHLTYAVSELPKGLYLVNVRVADTFLTRRFVIQ